MATYRPQSAGLVRARVRAENEYGVTFSREVTLQVAAAPAIVGGYHDRRRVYRGALSGPAAQVVEGGFYDVRRTIFPGVLTAEGTLPLAGGFVDRRTMFSGALATVAPGITVTASPSINSPLQAGTTLDAAAMDDGAATHPTDDPVVILREWFPADATATGSQGYRVRVLWDVDDASPVWSDWSEVVVANVAPVAADDVEAVVLGEEVTFDPRENDTDADGNPLTITAASIVSGGGSISHTGTSVTVTADNGAATGTDIVGSYTISDGQGGSDTGQFTISVTDTDVTAPAISSFDDSGAPDNLSFEIDEAALVHFRVAAASGQTTADVLGGGGVVSGSFDVPGGEVNHSLADDLAGVPSGTYHLAFVGEDAAGNATDPPVEIEITIPAVWELTAGDGSVTFTAVPPAPTALAIAAVGGGSVTFA